MGYGPSNQSENGAYADVNGNSYIELHAIRRAEAIYGYKGDNLTELELLDLIKTIGLDLKEDYQGTVDIVSVSIDRPNKQIKIIFEAMDTRRGVEARVERISSALGEYSLGASLGMPPLEAVSISPKNPTDVLE